ncbi:hypothetical protein ABKV19_008633 [Rosa sericea]
MKLELALIRILLLNSVVLQIQYFLGTITQNMLIRHQHRYEINSYVSRTLEEASLKFVRKDGSARRMKIQTVTQCGCCQKLKKRQVLSASS